MAGAFWPGVQTTVREMLGCAVMFAAAPVQAPLPLKNRLSAIAVFFDYYAGSNKEKSKNSVSVNVPRHNI